MLFLNENKQACSSEFGPLIVEINWIDTRKIQRHGQLRGRQGRRGDCAVCRVALFYFLRLECESDYCPPPFIFRRALFHRGFHAVMNSEARSSNNGPGRKAGKEEIYLK